MITGASAGLGEEFARQLAVRCGTLVLVARRGERLDQLKAELEEHHLGLRVEPVVTDLSTDEGLTVLLRTLKEKGLFPDLLINNAGLGDYGEFATAEWSRIDAMLQVNIRALTKLCHALAPVMKALGGGSILNVSSLGGDIPIPDFAVYAATKAYVSSFSEALRIELREFNVNVTTLCPGPIETEFGSVARRSAGQETGLPARSWFYVEREQAVHGAIQTMLKGGARHYPGTQVACLAAVLGILPLAAIRLIMGFRPRQVKMV
ncbi:SDR family oxidoreductase [Sulfuriroseicoccus oceanibius]|uniref:SDR family oxidoreductase n=1 Tax=Sulfuriroseicoccus oceanibius TaxID=2707525 RepID=A0A6B3L9J0_9BACT|nr:SDR family oxidoreductase [Sulfuriroseicoccus oceanibius]